LISLIIKSIAKDDEEMSEMEKDRHDVGPISDHDLLEKGDQSYTEDLRFSKLTPEELETEKKLRRRIDGRIMPLVILVYLMNCKSGSQHLCLSTLRSSSNGHVQISTATTMPPPGSKV
jgi:hypothetical protein